MTIPKMDFPEYIPQEVVEVINAILYGNESIHEKGYVQFLKELDDQLLSLKVSIDLSSNSTVKENLAGLHLELRRTEEQKSNIADEVACLTRLVADAGMQEVYEILNLENLNAQEKKDFIYSSWIAKIDYSQWRDLHKRVKELNQKIGKAASKLENLLREVKDVGYSHWPPEFFGVDYLLRQTDNRDEKVGDIGLWRGLRHLITGDQIFPPDHQKAEDNKEWKDEIKREIVFVAGKNGGDFEIDPEEQTRNTIRYAWGVAPELSDLLGTVKTASDNFIPTEQGLVRAGIQSRQTSAAQNKEYLRGFTYSLINNHRIQINSSLKKAIAITATIVINDPDFVVSYDDVTKAIDSL